MTAHAISAASLICLGRSSRAHLMRAMSQAAAARHATEFHSGMHAADGDAPDQVLAKNQMLVLDGQHLSVLCTEGQLWLTRDGDIEDYILGAGQRFDVRPDDHATVQALRASRVRLLPG